MNVKRNVSEIKRLFHERKELMHSCLRFLMSKGISFEIAEEILVERAEPSLPYIKESVPSRLHVAGELSFEKPTSLVFIGPTGVGKTTTILKLAGHYLKHKRKIALLTFDG